MKRLWLYFLLPLGLLAQGPSCVWDRDPQITSATTGTIHPNNTGNPQCNAFALTWVSTGFSGVTIQLEGADASGGSYSAFSASSPFSNPATSLSGAIVVQAVSSIQFIRANVTGVTGSGQIRYQIYGYNGVTAVAKSTGAGGTCGALGGDLSGTCAAATVVGIQGHAVSSVQGNGAKAQLSTGSTTTNDCVKFDANGNTVDAGGACGTGTGNLSGTPTNHGVAIGSTGQNVSFSAAGSVGQLFLSGGASADGAYHDFPDVKVIPAANCNNTTAGNGWSIGSGGTVTCRAGTNNLGGFIVITDTAATFAQFATAIPEDWDSGTNPYIRFQIASTDATNGHTIIPAIQVSCAKGDGSTTDDVTFNASHSLSTVTLNTTANQFWSTSNVQLNSTDMTGCVAGSLMIVQVGRATDTATNARFYSATMTFPRALVVQAN